jgi:hypothetical protein
VDRGGLNSSQLSCGDSSEGEYPTLEYVGLVSVPSNGKNNEKENKGIKP